MKALITFVNIVLTQKIQIHSLIMETEANFMAISKLRRIPFKSFVFLVLFSSITSTEAYDPLDPNGNITIIWDIMQWTPDGYVAVVNLYNYQQFRHIEAPGWTLGWTWAKNEIIWSMVGARTTLQGDCSRFKGNVPHSCRKDPKVIDLPPHTPSNMQVAHCCKGGVVSSFAQDPRNALSSILISVGAAGTTNNTVHLPKKFTLQAPEPGYTCGVARIVKPTRFITADGRRFTTAIMTWKVICTYSMFVAHKAPTCCVSLSSFNNDTIVDCPKCACSCRSNKTSCVKSDVKGSLIQCTSHMCPVKVHWHYRVEYRKYWRVRITISNFNYGMNYTNWNLVVQHPNFKKLAKVYGINYKALVSHSNDTAMLWGVKHYNSVLMEAGPHGNVQLELLFQKNLSKYEHGKGWAFPSRIYFNGANCVMPSPDLYPRPRVSHF